MRSWYHACMVKHPSSVRASKLRRRSRPKGSLKLDRPIHVFIDRETLAWIDGQSRSAGISRTGWLNRVLVMMRDLGQGMDQSGLFAGWEAQIERAVVKAIQDSKKL